MTSFIDAAKVLEILGRHVRGKRKYHGLSQVEAAQQMDIGTKTLERIEAGKPCYTSTAAKVLRWLEYGPGEG